MAYRTLIALAAAPALIAGVALAQATTTTYTKLDDDSVVVKPFNLQVGDIEDMDVYGPGDEQVGEVEEVLVDSSGAVVAFAVETDGFLGIGGEDVIVGVDHLQFIDDHFVTSLTEEELEALPRWED